MPVVALTGVLGWHLAGAYHARPPDSYYTEFAVEPATGSGTGVSVVVHSREQAALAFRFEARVGDVVERSDRFLLRPGERRVFPVPASGAGRVELRLYRADRSTPYRRLTL